MTEKSEKKMKENLKVTSKKNDISSPSLSKTEQIDFSTVDEETSKKICFLFMYDEEDNLLNDSNVRKYKYNESRTCFILCGECPGKIIDIPRDTDIYKQWYATSGDNCGSKCFPFRTSMSHIKDFRFDKTTCLVKFIVPKESIVIDMNVFSILSLPSHLKDNFDTVIGLSGKYDIVEILEIEQGNGIKDRISRVEPLPDAEPTHRVGDGKKKKD